MRAQRYSAARAAITVTLTGTATLLLALQHRCQLCNTATGRITGDCGATNQWDGRPGAFTAARVWLQLASHLAGKLGRRHRYRLAGSAPVLTRTTHNTPLLSNTSRLPTVCLLYHCTHVAILPES